MEAIIAAEIGAELGDESLVEYLSGMLAEAPNESESGDSVKDFLSSVGLEERDAMAASAKLFAALRAAGFGTIMEGGGTAEAEEPMGEVGGLNLYLTPPPPTTTTTTTHFLHCSIRSQSY
jgi:hypothetical protein